MTGMDDLTKSICGTKPGRGYVSHSSAAPSGLQKTVDGQRLVFMSTGSPGGFANSKTVIELAAMQGSSHMEGQALLSACIDKHCVSV